MKHTRTFVVQSEHGLHARPVAELAQVATAFQADIVLSGNGASANAKSVLSLLLLGAAKGAELTATADGADGAAALLAIERTSCLSGLAP
jgi:phosphotransferase system HPr (HPr) family protein